MKYPNYIEAVINDTTISIDELVATIEVWLDPFVKSGNDMLELYLENTNDPIDLFLRPPRYFP